MEFKLTEEPLLNIDAHCETRRIESFLSFCKKTGLFNGNVWLAGGAIAACINRDLPINDFDLFVTSQDEANRVRKIFDSNPTTSLIYECPNNTVYSYRDHKIGGKIQIVGRYHYPSKRALLDSFDFKVCQVCYDGISFEAYSYQVVSLINKKCLSIHKITRPTATLRRILSYTNEKGFSFANQEMTLFCKMINEGEFSEHNLNPFINQVYDLTQEEEITLSFSSDSSL